MLTREPTELRAAQDERLAGLERSDGRAPLGAGHDGELAEGLPRPADRESDDVAERRRDADVEAPLDDEMHRVRGIVAVEDDLAPPVRAAPRQRENGADVGAGDSREELPLHDVSQALHTLCRRRGRRAARTLLPSAPWSNGREGDGR